MTTVACIDVFCGVGGLTNGLISSGINVVAGVDIDAACRFPFEKNNGAVFILDDVARLSPERVKALFGNAEVRILAGCAPCQPFSTYSQRYDVVGSPKWGLLYKFSHLIRQTLPEIITIENVPSIEKHSVFGDFKSALRSLGYAIEQTVVDCSEYGLPQSRRRMVLLASRIGKIGLVNSKGYGTTTVRKAISRLPPIEHGAVHPRDPLHAASRLSELNLRRIKASVPGGTWRDWPAKLVADCHKRESGSTYPGVYGRMEWDKPAPTLTTQFYGFGNGRFGHPEQHRAISLREGAILQGFPKSYSFVPDGQPVQFKALGRMIGNAVPVTLGEVIGKSIAVHIGIEAEKEKRKKGAVADDVRKSLVA